MRRILYYFAGVPGMNRAMLADRGVLDRFTPRLGGGGDLIEHVVLGVDRGPVGTGCIVAAGPGVPAYAPERQTWIQGPKFWLAIEDAPPRTDDLVRKMGISGFEIQLADGGVWRVPLVKRWNPARMDHVANLPKSVAPVFADGVSRLVSTVRPEFAAIDAMGAWAFEAFIKETTIPLETVFQNAAALLAVNYKLGVEEVWLLGLLDETLAVQILRLACDLESVQAYARELAGEGIQYADPVVEAER